MLGCKNIIDKKDKKIPSALFRPRGFLRFIAMKGLIPGVMITPIRCFIFDFVPFLFGGFF